MRAEQTRMRAVLLIGVIGLAVVAVGFMGTALALPNITVEANVTDDSVTADGVEEVTFTVTVEDNEGDPIEDGTVAVDEGEDVDALDGLDAGDENETDEDGETTFTATSTDSGEFTVQFSVQGITDTATATFEAGEAADLSLSAAPDDETVTADGDGEISYTVTINDENGNPVDGVEIKGNASAGDDIELNDDGEIANETTDTNGTAEFTATSTVAQEDIEITFTEQENNNQGSGSATFQAGGVHSITTTIDGETEPTVPVQEAQTITVTAEDEFGNLIVGMPITVDGIDTGEDNVTVNGLDETAIDGTDENGEVTFENVSFDGNVGDTVDITTSAGEAEGQPDDTLTVTLGAGEVADVTAEIGSDTDPTVSVGTVVTMTVASEDEFGNPVGDVPITIDAIDDGGDDVTVNELEEGDTSETTAQGQALFTGVSFVGEVDSTVEITASAEDGISDTMVVTLDTGPLAEITASIDRETEPTVLVDDEQTITVAAEDAGGNSVESAEIGVYEINDSGDGVTVSGLDEGEFNVTDGDGMVTFDDVAFDGNEGASVNLTFLATGFGPESTATGPPLRGVVDTMTVTLEVPAEDPDPEPAPDPGSAEFELAIVDTNAPVMEGRSLRVTAQLENVGDAPGTRTVEFAVANHTDERSITLDPSRSTETTFRWDTTADDVGNHTVEVRADGSVATTNVTVHGERPRYLGGEIHDDSPDSIHLTFDQDVRLSGVIPDTDGFTVHAGDEELALLDVTADGRQAIVDLERSVAAGQDVEVSYDGESDNLQSRSGVEAEPFEDELVDTQVETTPPVVANLSASIPGVGLVADSVSVGSDVSLIAVDSLVPVGADASYDWEVDGETFTTDEPELTRTFDEPGEVTAQVTVTADSQSGTASATFEVVDDEPPDVQLAASESIGVGEDPGFDASGSTDNVAIANYAWDFGDGTTEEGAELTRPDHTYDEPGEYEATVTVTDTSGNAETATMTVTVDEPDEEEAGFGPSPWLLLLALVIVGVALASYYYYRRRR